MPIPVTCPSCHARFQVSEKFAGKKGPCPKCKNVITIPKADQQVKIDDRAHGGTKDASGRLVLKPIERAKFKAKPLLIGGIVVAVIAAIAAAYAFGGLYESNPKEMPWFVLALGAFVVGVPVSAAGYSFLRDDELEPHSGLALWLRSLAASAGFLVLWLLYYYFVPPEYRDLQGAAAMSALAILPFIAGGAFIAVAAFDLGIANGAFHYALYLVCCIVLCLAAGWPMTERVVGPDAPGENKPPPVLTPQFGAPKD